MTEQDWFDQALAGTPKEDPAAIFAEFLGLAPDAETTDAETAEVAAPVSLDLGGPGVASRSADPKTAFARWLNAL